MQTKRIHQLPQSVISKIAAGEVIERPVYAVKELIENSLDAGADTIKILVEESGLKRIHIIDNGQGMSREDLEVCFKPHTTSKLQNEEDLHHISSLGFRGEALSSIAAISRMMIASRTEKETGGNTVTLFENKVSQVKPIGIPVGTQVTIEDLFYSVPARKKFLKSQRTEFRLIIDTVTYFALSHPHVHFTFVHNGKTIFDLPKSQELFERVTPLLGKDIFENLLPIEIDESYVSLKGFISKPQITTKTPHKQFLYINNRKINDKMISMNIKSAYGTALEKNVYPVCILFFSAPHEFVDVNVHPKKDSVRFADAQQVLIAVEKAVRKTLAEQNILFNTNTWKSAIFLGDTDPLSPKRSTHSFAGKLLKEKELPWKLLQKNTINTSHVMQMHNLYLVASTADGMVLIDQHAAHERVLYEQYREELLKEKKKKKIHTFTKSKTLELNPSDKEILEEHKELLEEHGFVLEHFKNNTYLLRSVPILLQDQDPKGLLLDVIEDLRTNQYKNLDDIDRISEKMLAFLACRSAVKAGDKLTQKQAKDLIEQLEITPHNTTCPHGRPTRVVINIEMLHKMFKR